MELYTLKDALALTGENPQVIYEEVDGVYYVGLKQRKGDAFYPMHKARDIHEARNLKTWTQSGLREIREHIAQTANKFYTIDELLPVINESARSYCDAVADTYVAGIEFNDELYPMVTLGNAAEADAYCAELDRTLDYHFKPVQTEFDDEEAQLLAGFTFVPNKGMSHIYVGKRNRLYLKGDVLSQLGIKTRARVLIAYNPAEKAFAVVKPSAPSLSAEMREAGYFVSNRKDVTAAKLFRQFNLDKYEGQTFYADTASLSGNVVIFKQ